MIKTLEIKNFKSIKYQRLDCKRINIFIGEPNTGKSNLLETVALFSYGCYGAQGYNFKDFVRFERIGNLFYDENLHDTVEVKFDSKALDLEFKDGVFQGKITVIDKQWDKPSKLVTFDGGVSDVYHRGGDPKVMSSFKFYRFVVKETFNRPESDFLLPPSGDNLFSLLLAHRELKATAGRLFTPFGLRLGFRPQERKLEVIKQIEDTIISYPYSLASETLQRLVFHMAAILSNKDSVLAFEEPETHAFPYYTKYLAEVIALDTNNNQYFITTHNPYFLLPILEKCPREDIGVFITYFEDYQTKVKPLSEKDMAEIMQIDVFSNLDRFLKPG